MDKYPQQPNKRRFWNHLSTNTLVRFLLFAACIWVLLQFLLYFKDVILVFTFATILALMLNYPVLT